MAFPHPKSRKENYRNGHIPNNGGVVWKLFKRTINVTDYRNPEDDVNPAKDRMFHVGYSFRYKVGRREQGLLAARGKIRTAQWAHFDECVSRSRIPRCPLQCSIQVWHVDDDEPPEIFLRFGIRAVMDLAFSVSDRYHCGRLRRLQTCPCDEDARSPQGFPISPASGRSSGLCVCVLKLINSLFVYMHK